MSHLRAGAWSRGALPLAVLAVLLTPGGVAPAGATMPGADGRIGFASDRTGTLQIYSMRPDGSDVRQLTHAEGNTLAPDWSPDGTRITFQIQRELTGHFDSEVYVMNADGSGLRRLTSSRPFDGAPAFSPDGGQIAFTSFRGGNPDVWQMNADGTRQRRLIGTPYFDWDPQYSPDGSQIAFTSIRRDSTSAVFLVHTNGSRLRRLTPWDLNGGHADWSPDGSLILFNSLDDVPGPSQLYVIRPDRTGLRALTSNTEITYYDASFSPQGDRITCEARYFVGDRREFDILVMNADGSRKRKVTSQPSTDLFADWGAAA